jgi:hypothetical protein
MGTEYLVIYIPAADKKRVGEGCVAADAKFATRGGALPLGCRLSRSLDNRY